MLLHGIRPTDLHMYQGRVRPRLRIRSLALVATEAARARVLLPTMKCHIVPCKTMVRVSYTPAPKPSPDTLASVHSGRPGRCCAGSPQTPPGASPGTRVVFCGAWDSWRKHNNVLIIVRVDIFVYTHIYIETLRSRAVLHSTERS